MADSGSVGLGSIPGRITFYKTGYNSKEADFHEPAFFVLFGVVKSV